jgi:hypothetical protein
MEHLQECAKVAGINLAAFMMSCSGVEEFFRIAGLIAAFIYTLLKIYELIKNLKG